MTLSRIGGLDKISNHDTIPHSHRTAGQDDDDDDDDDDFDPRGPSGRPTQAEGRKTETGPARPDKSTGIKLADRAAEAAEASDTSTSDVALRSMMLAASTYQQTVVEPGTHGTKWWKKCCICM